MNQVVTIQEEGSQPTHMGLVPASMGEAMQLATMMSQAKLVPAALQKSPADCLMVIQQAIRWQMDPFAVAQECSVIQGKLMHSGKLVAAVINARGNLASRLSFSYEGEGDNRSITVTGRLYGESEARSVTVRLKDAKTANAMWQRQPDQQLMYHGSRVWARRHTPELMLGVYSPEEFDEAPATPRRPAPPAANVMLLPAPEHDKETGEIVDASPQRDAVDAPVPQTNSHTSLKVGNVKAQLSAGISENSGGSNEPPEILTNEEADRPSLEAMAREAAMRGRDVLVAFCRARTAQERKVINAMKDELEALYP
jgi:hypothetical protein